MVKVLFLLQALEGSAAEDGAITDDDPTVEMDGIQRRSWEMEEIQRSPESAVTWKAVLIQGSVLLVFLICGGLVFWVLEGGKNATQQVSEQVEPSVTLATSLLHNVTKHLRK